jgi:hypothetical protein
LILFVPERERAACVRCLRQAPEARTDLTDVKQGVVFDLDGDGTPEHTAWTKQNGDIGFLALDRNNNGYIDSGKELFGNVSHPGRGNGFAALLQDAGMGSPLEEGHPLYDKLVLWTDRNHNGISETDELEPFKNLYSTLDLSYDVTDKRDKHGNQFLYRGNAVIRTGPGKNRLQTREEKLERLVRVER